MAELACDFLRNLLIRRAGLTKRLPSVASVFVIVDGTIDLRLYGSVLVGIKPLPVLDCQGGSCWFFTRNGQILACRSVG